MHYYYCGGKALDSIDKVFDAFIETCYKLDLIIKSENRQYYIIELENKIFITFKQKLNNVLVEIYDFSNQGSKYYNGIIDSFF